LSQSHHCLAISGGPRWSSCRYRPPRSVRNRVHPLVGFALLQSSSCCPLPDLATERLPWGFVPLRDINTRSPHPDGRSRAHLRSALGVSRALDGFLLRVPCELVSSRCRVQGSRFRGLLPRASRDLFRGPLPSRRWRRLPVGVATDTGRRRVDLKAFIQPGIRCARGGFSPHESPVSPLALVLPRALLW